MDKKQIITIAGKPGSGKSTTARLVASQLGFQHFSSGDLFRALAKEQGIELLNANLTAEENSELDNKVDARLREIGRSEDQIVIDSRTAWHWMPKSFKVYLDLDLEVAAERILQGMDDERLASEHIHRDTEEYALLLQRRLESESRRYVNLYNINPFDTSNYDLVIDTKVNSIDQVVLQVYEGFKAWLKLDSDSRASRS